MLHLCVVALAVAPAVGQGYESSVECLFPDPAGLPNFNSGSCPDPDCVEARLENLETCTAETDDAAGLTPAPTTQKPTPRPTPYPTTLKPTDLRTIEICQDSTTWYYKKEKNTCDSYIAKKGGKCKNKDPTGEKAKNACPVSCDECPTSDDDCASDSTTWFYKKDKNTCADYVAKKSKNCKKEDDNGVTAEEASPVTCGADNACKDACADSTTWFYKKEKNTCADYVAKKSKNCKKKDKAGMAAEEACPVTCEQC